MSEKNTSLTPTGTPAVAEGVKPDKVVVPDTDLYETENGWILEADLPGARRESLNLEVDGEVLSLEAEAATGGSGTAVYREFEPVRYRRRFRLGDPVDAGRITAELKNGVLTLELPRTEAARPRKIKIKS